MVVTRKSGIVRVWGYPHQCVRRLQIKILNSIITSILPGLALTVFLAVLPMILTLLNRHVQKMISETQIDFGVVRKYFAFQVGHSA